MVNSYFEKYCKVVEKNKHKNNMLGDLCRDIAADMDFPWTGDYNEVYRYLDYLVDKHGDYLKEPVRRFKISLIKSK